MGALYSETSSDYLWIAQSLSCSKIGSAIPSWYGRRHVVALSYRINGNNCCDCHGNDDSERPGPVTADWFLHWPRAARAGGKAFSMGDVRLPFVCCWFWPGKEKLEQKISLSASSLQCSIKSTFKWPLPMKILFKREKMYALGFCIQNLPSFYVCFWAPLTKRGAIEWVSKVKPAELWPTRVRFGSGVWMASFQKTKVLKYQLLK